MIRKKILAGYAANWLIWNFVWVVATFYLGSNSPAQQRVYATVCLLAWVISLAIGLLILARRTGFIDRYLESLARGERVPDEELRVVSQRSLNLSMYGLVLYAVMWIICDVVAFIPLLAFGPFGPRALYAMWVGGTAGIPACPSMVMGTFGVLSGAASRVFSLELEKRGLKTKGRRFNLWTKWFICFIGIAIGYGIWLGGLGYYTGLRQSIAETKSSSLTLQAAIINNIRLRTETEPGLKDLRPIIDEIKPDKMGFAFLADSQGNIVYNPREEDIFVKRWTDINENLIEGIKSGQPGGIYENVGERIISYSPINSEYILGTVSYLSERAARLNMFWIWLGVFVLGALIVVPVDAGTLATWTSGSISRVSSILKKVSAGDFTKRIPIETEDEVGDLVEDCNVMTVSLEDYRNRLEKSKAEIENILQSQIDLVFVIDTKGAIIRVNRAVLDTLGCREDELLGRHISEVFVKEGLDEIMEKGPKKGLKGELTFGLEMTLLTKQGEKILATFNGGPIKDAAGNIVGAVGVGRDMRDINRLIGELRDARNGLEIKVKERTKELEQARNSLEIKVKERTKELEEARNNLEEKVAERTRELQTKVKELAQFNELAVGRELKMIELKKELAELKAKSDQML